MTTKDYQITGMTCSNCVDSIKGAVKKIPEVKQVDINLSLNLMTVSSEAEINNDTILKTVKKTGYHAKLVKNNQFRTGLDKAMVFKIIQVVIALLLTLPMWLGMILAISGVHNEFVMFLHNPWFQLVITSIVQFVLGARFFKEFYNGLKSLQANMAFLVVIGTLSAYGLSIYNAFVNNWQATMDGEILYFELSATIITFVLLGKLLEEGAKTRTGNALNQLVKLLPQKALVLINDQTIELPLDEVLVNQHVVVKAGDSIPFDGFVFSGSGTVNESMLTGESAPVKKQVNDQVSAGTINLSGYLVIQVEKLVNQSTIAQVIETVKLAQNKKTNIQLFVDKISSYFIPVIFGIAIITLIGWTIYFQGWNQISLIRAITVLVIACPCALGLATPTAVLVGTSKSANLGIIFKSANSLEKLAKTDFLVFDKTGTLTQGELKISEFEIINPDYQSDKVKAIIYNFELLSEHSIGQGIVKSLAPEFGEQPKLKIQNFETLPSLGITGVYQNQVIHLGNQNLMTSLKIDLTPIQEQSSNWQEQGLTVVYVAINQKLVAMIGVGDILKPHALEMLEKLKQLKIAVAMLTGDSHKTAKAIGAKLNLDQIISEVKIFEKAEEIKKLKQQYETVGMIGDGINDAIALNEADVGVTFGNATDVAIDSSDILVLQDDIRNVARAVVIARKTYNKIKTNLFWAFLYNVLAIPLAAFGLIFPELGALIMVLSSVSVILNSLFLRVK